MFDFFVHVSQKTKRSENMQELDEVLRGCGRDLMDWSAEADW